MALSISRGTLIVAANTENGIVVGSDSRSSGKPQRGDEVKLARVGPYTLAAVRGHAALLEGDLRFLLTDRLRDALTDRIPIDKPESFDPSKNT